MKDCSIKLKVQDYVFEIDKKDLTKAELTIQKNNSIIVKSGLNEDLINSEYWDFEITAYDEKNKKYCFSFLFENKNNIIKNPPKDLVSINNLILEGETFLYRADERARIIYLTSEKDIYKKSAQAWITKIDDKIESVK